MTTFLNTRGSLSYIEMDLVCKEFELDLDLLPEENYTLEEVYNFFDVFIDQIKTCEEKDVRIVLSTKNKSIMDSLNLFLTFSSILSRNITGKQKEGEKRLAPRSEIMDNTSVDLITMKRFLNYECIFDNIEIELRRKNKLIAAL